MRLRCTVAYDGTEFHGFQRQSGSLRTVQSVLEDALQQLAGRAIRISGSGRTDAGVHAEGQVVHFDWPDCPIPVERLAAAWNSKLPEDVKVQGATEAAPDFHARYSAIRKTYRYRIWRRVTPHPLVNRTSWHVPRQLDWSAMQQTAALFLGEHDFAALCAAGSSVEDTVRRVEESTWVDRGDVWEFWTTADGFLYKMVRAMVGLSVEAGRGRLSLEEIQNLLERKRRDRRIVTAPARGLCLVRVDYP